MGYTTDFSGSLQLSRQLTEVEKNYINEFSRSRRMKRDINVLWETFKGKNGYPSPEKQTPEDCYGRDGEYYIGDDSTGVIDHNTPPGKPSRRETINMDFETAWNKEQEMIKNGECQPGLWCQWIINEENELEWDGGEKFYEYTAWLKYLIFHFFSKWGVILNGEIEWQGEDPDDIGKIVVKDNIVEEKQGRKVYD